MKKAINYHDKIRNNENIRNNDSYEKTVYLIRHAEPEHLFQEKYYLGQSDPPLSMEGMRQAQQLADYLQAIRLEAIYCSDLQRAVQTALCIAERQHCRLEKCKALREINMGCWEGLLMEEVRRLYPAEYERRGADLVHFCPPQGESFTDLQNRAVSAFREIVNRNEGDIAIVAHAGVNRAILCDLLAVPLSQMFEIKQDYACINRIQYFRRKGSNYHYEYLPQPYERSD